MEPISNNPEKTKVLKALFFVFVLLALFLGVQTLSALKEYSYIGNGPAANVIAVNGTGEVFAIPDTATFSFSVTETGKTVAAAQDTASKKINSIIDAVKAMGVEDKDIKTTGYNSYPKYEYSNFACPAGSSPAMGYCPPGKQVLTGYEVSQTIEVKVRKTDDAGAILTKVGGLGAENISGLNFVVDNPDAVQAQARDKAVADARAKASVLAKSLGIKLNKIVNFYESGNQPPVYYGVTAMEKSASGGLAPTVPQVPTGENKITSNVTITYEVK